MRPSARDVLDFWFAAEQQAHWFEKNDAFDAQIRSRFGALHQHAADGELDSWTLEPESWLALLIVLDQFSRNLYREDARAYAADAKARNLVLPGLARGDDVRLSPLQRVFAYIPLEHAEDLALQNRAVDLFMQLSKDVSEGERSAYLNYLDYACRHRDVIARFGRFPHRNQVLGRVSTAAELAYLSQPSAGF
jgi:uncharacterized protein (DUF924 family)